MWPHFFKNCRFTVSPSSLPTVGCCLLLLLLLAAAACCSCARYRGPPVNASSCHSCCNTSACSIPPGFTNACLHAIKSAPVGAVPPRSTFSYAMDTELQGSSAQGFSVQTPMKVTASSTHTPFKASHTPKQASKLVKVPLPQHHLRAQPPDVTISQVVFNLAYEPSSQTEEVRPNPLPLPSLLRSRWAVCCRCGCSAATPPSPRGR